MPVCPWPHLVVFIFGAGAALLSIALVGNVAFNGKFGDDNKFRQYNFGLDTTIGRMAIANVSTAMFAVVFVMFAIAFNIKHLPDKAQLVMWVLAMLAFLSAVLSQVLSLTYTKYGDEVVPSVYSYYDNNEKFKKYIDGNFDHILSKTGDIKVVFKFGLIPVNYSLFNSTDLEDGEWKEPSGADVSLEQFYITFYQAGRKLTVPSCVMPTVPINDSAEAWLAPGFVMMGYDPCNFFLTTKECIGGWTNESFRNYWCYEYRSQRTMRKETEGLSQAALQKYQAVINRQKISIDSYSAFYEVNSIFLGMEATGFVVLVIALALNMIVQPFDTKSISYKKIEASGSGSASAKRAKAVSSGSASKSGSKQAAKPSPGRVKMISESSSDSS